MPLKSTSAFERTILTFFGMMPKSTIDRMEPVLRKSAISRGGSVRLVDLGLRDRPMAAINRPHRAGFALDVKQFFRRIAAGSRTSRSSYPFRMFPRIHVVGRDRRETSLE